MNKKVIGIVLALALVGLVAFGGFRAQNNHEVMDDDMKTSNEEMMDKEEEMKDEEMMDKEEMKDEEMKDEEMKDEDMKDEKKDENMESDEMKDEMKDTEMKSDDKDMMEDTKDDEMMESHSDEEMMDDSKESDMKDTDMKESDMKDDEMMDKKDEMKDEEMKDDEMKDEMKEESKEVMKNDGNAAKDFTLKDLDGNDVTLSSLQGEKVYVKFWASWCSICLAGLDEIDSLAGEDDIRVITIVSPGHNGEKNTEDFKEWFATRGTENLEVLLDEGGDITKAYGVRAYPTSVYIGSDGVLVKVLPGHNGNDTIKAFFENIH